MNIAFTICSNNYLAHAKTLGDSFLKYHLEFKFVIGLVDKYDPQFDYSFFSDFEIITVDEIPIKEFEELRSKYNITELNTSVKPAYFHYLFKKYRAAKVLYIDPDILVTSRFVEVLEILDEKNIVLTPHLLTPVDDGFSPSDHHTLAGGVFNLGFIGLSNYEILKGFLDWWHQRVVKYGFMSYCKAMFYDQLWINYVPCLYDNYYILKHGGYNMANWNLHERVLNKTKDGFEVNTKMPLRFFHFSSYHYTKPDIICAYLTRFDFLSRPDLKTIFDNYQKLLKENKIEIISKLFVYYYPDINKPKTVQHKSAGYKILKRLQLTSQVLFYGHIK